MLGTLKIDHTIFSLNCFMKNSYDFLWQLRNFLWKLRNNNKTSRVVGVFRVGRVTLTQLLLFCLSPLPQAPCPICTAHHCILYTGKNSAPGFHSRDKMQYLTFCFTSQNVSRAVWFSYCRTILVYKNYMPVCEWGGGGSINHQCTSQFPELKYHKSVTKVQTWICIYEMEMKKNGKWNQKRPGYIKYND